MGHILVSVINVPSLFVKETPRIRLENEEGTNVTLCIELSKRVADYIQEERGDTGSALRYFLAKSLDSLRRGEFQDSARVLDDLAQLAWVLS